MNKTIEQTLGANEGNVSRLAYQMWEEAGRPGGRDLEFWLAAEGKLRAASQVRTATVAAVETPSVPAQSKTSKTPRAARGGIKKSWPKPYPSLPKF